MVLILIAHVGLNLWIKNRLPVVLNRENDSQYEITYGDLEVSLLSRSMMASDIIVVPKASLVNKATKEGFYAKINSVEIARFKIFDIIFNDKLRAQAINITKPEIIIYELTEEKKKDPRRIREKVVEPFRKIILVSEIAMSEGDLKILYVKSNDPILHISNIAFEIDGIVLTDATLEQKIPFGFDQYKISCDSVYYRPNPYYGIRAGKFQTNNNSLSIANASYLPRVSRQKFVASLPLEKDLFTVKTGNISIDSIDWGFKNDKFFLHTKKIQLDDVAANVYRSKIPPDDPKKKHLYNKLLREIPFDLHVEKFEVRHGTIQYEEEKTFEKGSGLLSFNNLYMTAHNLSSGYGQKKVPNVVIDVNCKFMNLAPMKLHWTMNVLDQSDGFNISGSILKFPAAGLTPFTKPYMNVTAEGMLDKIYFNYTGNDAVAKGDFAVEYDDLKFNILQKKDRKKKNKVLSAIANLFVKNDTKDRVKQTDIEVDRLQDKSFFNFFWRMNAEGLKKLLI
jgi:hypothetical protein